ncbi:hypothetical protein EG329_013794 [Mollisiaceae sp. DMI_Dod_QoI]|nr:hypothetical protein EG329_013794 [Helotiales sp. DMI_Dod_QoI]
MLLRVAALATIILVFADFTKAQPAIQNPLNLEQGDSDCHNACSALVSTFGSSAFYDPSSSLSGFRDSFYTTQQRDVVPACIVTPNSADEVAHVIRVIRQHRCIFAVKSGGHALFVGGSNAPGGITIDLRKLDEIDVAEDLQTAKVGTGNRWKRVYEKLEPLNRTAVGGRNGEVGVGGFILGGGISFVSRRHGWALDNVRNFEVVLGNGTIINANQTSSPDLYWALRGGGNNFGIVTKFDLEIHPQGLVWAGQNFWLMDTSMISARRSLLNITTSPATSSLSYLKNAVVSGIANLLCRFGYCVTSKQAFRAFRSVVLAEQSDVYAQMYMSFAYAWQVDQFLICAALVYSKPEPWPPVFEDYKAMKSLYSSAKIQKLTTVYEEVSSLNEIGYRQMWAAIAFKMSEELLEKIFDLYVIEVESVKHVKDVIPALLVQPINRDEIAIFKKNGGNCLGLEDVDGPLVLFSIAFRWSNTEDDNQMNEMGKTIIDCTVDMAKEMGLHHRYIYQNYANASQDVFGGYGDENRLKLKEIQMKYDPEGVFSRLQPGYFKI